MAHPGAGNNEHRLQLMLAAVCLTLQQPIDISKGDMKPGEGEAAEDFLERFKKPIYGNQSGDTQYEQGNDWPRFCAMVMNCLPSSVAMAI